MGRWGGVNPSDYISQLRSPSAPLDGLLLLDSLLVSSMDCSAGLRKEALRVSQGTTMTTICWDDVLSPVAALQPSPGDCEEGGEARNSRKESKSIVWRED